MNSEISRTILSNWNILIVDDDPDSLEIASLVLSYYGANVYTAPNGRAALKILEAVIPQFIICDLSMPEMNGWELLKHLAADRSTAEIPLIALTAHAMQGDRERAIALGFYNYLTKPLTASSFIHQLLSLLTDIPRLAEKLNAGKGE
jgi:two-component system, cell cycle response regulator DivK